MPIYKYQNLEPRRLKAQWTNKLQSLVTSYTNMLQSSNCIVDKAHKQQNARAGAQCTAYNSLRQN